MKPKKIPLNWRKEFDKKFRLYKYCFDDVFPVGEPNLSKRQTKAIKSFIHSLLLSVLDEVEKIVISRAVPKHTAVMAIINAILRDLNKLKEKIKKKEVG